MTPDSPGRRLAGGWFDAALAAGMFIACETELIVDSRRPDLHAPWPLAVNVLIVAFLTIPLAGRRRAPLSSVIIVMTSVLLLVFGLAAIQTVNFPQLVLFIAPYSVAAYAGRRRALIGLAACGAAIAAVNLTSPSNPTSWVFSVGACSASWTIGRVIRSRRTLAIQLQRTSERLRAEREGRELLAIADQRTRIARELQALVANSVSTMIVQTQAAQRLLGDDLGRADAAMEVIENTGRQALVEMRRILGVLRHDVEEPELLPQPGVGQIAALLETARHAQRRVALVVEGEPGPLPASVDIGLYRILEDAMATVDVANQVDIALRFQADDIELTVTSRGATCLDWPSVAVRERVALCQGVVDVDTLSDPGERLVVRLPRIFEPVMT